MWFLKDKYFLTYVDHNSYQATFNNLIAFCLYKALTLSLPWNFLSRLPILVRLQIWVFQLAILKTPKHSSYLQPPALSFVRQLYLPFPLCITMNIETSQSSSYSQVLEFRHLENALTYGLFSSFSSKRALLCFRQLFSGEITSLELSSKF